MPILGSKNGQGLPVPLWFLPWKEQVVELKRMVSILYLQKPHVHIWLPRNGKVIIIGINEILKLLKDLWGAQVTVSHPGAPVLSPSAQLPHG